MVCFGGIKPFYQFRLREKPCSLSLVRSVFRIESSNKIDQIRQSLCRMSNQILKIARSRSNYLNLTKHFSDERITSQALECEGGKKNVTVYAACGADFHDNVEFQI